jgi:transposase InsO family protein
MPEQVVLTQVDDLETENEDFRLFVENVLRNASSQDPMEVDVNLTEDKIQDAAWSSRTQHCYAEMAGKSTDAWLVDSACSRHMTGDSSLLRSLEPVLDCKIRFGDGSRISAIAEGILHLSCGEFKVLYAPALKVNLLSVPQLMDSGINTHLMAETESYIESKEGRIPVIRHGKLLKLDLTSEEQVNSMEVEEQRKILQEWHVRIGHIDQHVLRRFLILKDKLPKDSKAEIPFCKVCAMAKLIQRRSEKRQVFSKHVLGRLHSDITGPLDKSWEGFIYFVNVVDDNSRFAAVSRLRKKSEAGHELQRICKQWMSAANKPLVILRSDGGGEFESLDMQRFYEENGIRHEPVPAYTPSMNGMAERLNRTLMEKVRCLLFTCGLSMRFWPEALDYAVYLYNRSPHRGLGFKTPLETFNGDSRELLLDKLFTFGSVCFYCVPTEHRSKLQPMGIRSLFLGMSSTAYLVLTLPELELKQVRTIRVDDGTFLEATELKSLGIEMTSRAEQEVINDEEYDSPYVPEDVEEPETVVRRIQGNKGATSPTLTSLTTGLSTSLSSLRRSTKSQPTSHLMGKAVREKVRTDDMSDHGLTSSSSSSLMTSSIGVSSSLSELGKASLSSGKASLKSGNPKGEVRRVRLLGDGLSQNGQSRKSTSALECISKHLTSKNTTLAHTLAKDAEMDRGLSPRTRNRITADQEGGLLDPKESLNNRLHARDRPPKSRPTPLTKEIPTPRYFQVTLKIFQVEEKVFSPSPPTS